MTIDQLRLIKPGAALSALIAVSRMKNEDEFGHDYYNADYPGPVHVVKVGKKASLVTEDGDERHSLHNENGFLLVLACLDEKQQVYERIASCRYHRSHGEGPNERTFFGQTVEKTISII